MAEKFYLVELRCGTCGNIFCDSGKRYIPEHKKQEYVDMFTNLGPDKFVQCKNRCPRQKQGPMAIIVPESPTKAPKNWNQRVIVTEIPEAELRMLGLMG